MGTTPVKLVNGTDTWVYQYQPTIAKGTAGHLLYTSAVSAKNMRSLIYFPLPFPRGVTIISAKLRFYQYTALTGSVMVSVQRAAAKWSATRATWNNQPAGGGGAVQVTKSSPVHNTEWEWDVTSFLQSVSNGAGWYGFLVQTTFNGRARFYSPQTTSVALRPVLEVAWKENPDKPTFMSPSNGRATSLAKPVLQTNFVDRSGDTTMQSINVRIFDTEAAAIANTTPTWDSGTVASSIPELDLNTTSYPGAAVDSVKFWRVRVQDGAGLWSDWSEYTSFARKAKGVLTITNPSGSTIADSSPPITWTFTGTTQRSYQILVDSYVGGVRTNTYDSGKITSTSLTATVPDKALKTNNISYVITVRVWDTVDRETTPGDSAYVEATRTVTYAYDGTVAAATGLTSTHDPDYPWMKLDWSRSALPDEWSILRDGKVIAKADGVDFFVSGTAYTYTDRLADPRVPHTWTVVAVVNGKGSANSPTTTKTITPDTITLSRQDGTNPVLIWNPNPEMALAENSTVFQPAGAAPPVLITQSEHGYQGRVKGLLAASPTHPAVTAQQWRDRYNDLKKNNGITLLLTVIDMAFECFIANATITPVMTAPGRIDYEVEFDFYQTDWEEVP